MTVYYCWSGATGAGTGLTQADAFTSLQSFLNIKANSDICYLRGTQTLAASLTDNINLTNNTPAQIIGVDATWTDTGERAIIDGNSTAPYCLNLTAASTFLRLRNIEFTNPTLRGISANNNYIAVITNCKFSNCPESGVRSAVGCNIFQSSFSGNLRDVYASNRLSINSCFLIGGTLSIDTVTVSHINLCIFHDYSSIIFQSCIETGITNCILDDAPLGLAVFNLLNISSCRITNITGLAVNVSGVRGGAGYYNTYFYNPAGSDVGGTKSGAYTDLGYNRLTPSNAGDGYSNPAIHDFTLNPVTDLSVGVSVPIGWINETVNISYPTGGIPPAFPAPTTPVCLGITRFEPLTNGKFYVEWDPGTGTITTYNIYIRAGSAPLFTAAYCAKQICYSVGVNYTILSLDADQESFLTHGVDYYCSVKAANGTSEDVNTAVLNNICSGNEGVQRQINTNFVIR